MTSSTREILDLISDESSGAEENVHTRDASLSSATSSPAPSAPPRPRSRSPAYHQMNEEEGERKEAVQPTRKRRREQGQQQNGDPLPQLMEQNTLDLIAIEDDDEQQHSIQT